jgi:hypothetical protein
VDHKASEWMTRWMPSGPSVTTFSDYMGFADWGA